MGYFQVFRGLKYVAMSTLGYVFTRDFLNGIAWLVEVALGR